MIMLSNFAKCLLAIYPALLKICLQGSLPADGHEHRDEHGAHAGSAHACGQKNWQHCRQGDHNNLIKMIVSRDEPDI